MTGDVASSDRARAKQRLIMIIEPLNLLIFMCYHSEQILELDNLANASKVKK